eukprot:gb/GEZN01010131.1/.p2 GENE.gb/GEZN01010131.1/~~gb/GEZN01010131.1/.p2  ORF type:complete len:116 (+),score=15.14 gb/GEZN01010131.1/:116-463(+)
MSSKRERRQEGSTLVVVLRALVGMRLKVELRNETVLIGRIEEVEDDMGMKLSSVKRTVHEGQQDEQETLIVKGTQVRYVHIPDAVDIPKLLQAYENKLARAQLKSRRPKHAPKTS